MSDRPADLKDYVALSATWGAALTTVLWATDTAPAPPGRELPVIGLATFTVAKAISKEKIGRPVRAPLVESDGNGNRSPRNTGLRGALGELVTCSRCLGPWSSLALVGLRVARPREGQILTSVLAVAAINDVLQAGFAFASSAANYEEAHANVEMQAV